MRHGRTWDHHVASAVAALRERLRAHAGQRCARPRARTWHRGARAAIMRDTFAADSEQEAVRIAGEPMMDLLNFLQLARARRLPHDPGEARWRPSGKRH
jgi:hypothetical protein